MNTQKYLELVKIKLEIESDYALAKHLEITKAAVSLLVNGHTVMSNTTAARVAEILGIDPMRVIADMELERGSDEALWKRIARKVATVMLPTVGAAALAAGAAVQSGVCVLC